MASRRPTRIRTRGPGPIPKREKARYPIESRIRDAAERVFAEHGLRGASLAAVAKGAELSLATVTRHVDGIDRLYRDVLERVAGELRERVPEVGGRDPEAWMLSVADVLVDKPHRARLLMRDLLDGGKVFGAVMAAELRSLEDSVRELTGSGTSEGAEPDLRTATILALLTHATLGPIATAYATPEALRLNLRLRRNRTVFLDTVRSVLREGLPR